MEANKIESERCVSFAKNEAVKENYEKAIKFLEKSIKLYPSELAKNLLNEYTQKLSTRQSSTNSDPSQTTSNSNSSYSSSANKQQDNDHKEYSADQADAVKKIKNCRDFYEILGVPKSSTEADLKKAYRKLALQFHPDKNKAPGATDAFKAIGKAFAILSDAQKRKQYDQYGPDSFDDSTTSPSQSSTRNRYHRAHSSHYNTYYWNDDDFSADELFNLFFGTGAAYNSASNRHRNHHQRHQSNNGQANFVFTNSNNYAVLFQLMPILLIVILSLLSNFMIGEPLYNLQRTNKYTVKRTTNEHKVMYFVKNDFKLDSAAELAKLERQVEEDLHMELRQSCFREKSYKETAIWRARNYGDERLLKKAMEYETPSCDRIRNIFGAG